MAGMATALFILPQQGAAQTDIELFPSPTRSLGFTALLGARTGPGYPGDAGMVARPDFRFGFLSFRSRDVNFGAVDVEDVDNDPFARPSGFAVGASLGFAPARQSSDFSELVGLDDVDASIELGIGAAYVARNLELRASARYGLTGHNSWLGDVRAYYVVEPTDGLVVRAGPRLEIGSDRYAQTYFGVSEGEALASAFPAYDANGGLISAGVDLIATYEVADDWWIEFGASWDRFMGDAANSPIVQHL